MNDYILFTIHQQHILDSPMYTKLYWIVSIMYTSWETLNALWKHKPAHNHVRHSPTNIHFPPIVIDSYIVLLTLSIFSLHHNIVHMSTLNTFHYTLIRIIFMIPGTFWHQKVHVWSFTDKQIVQVTNKGGR